MFKRFFYSPTGKPYLWRCALAMLFAWVVVASIGLHMVIESNIVGQLIQYVKAEIAK